MKAVLVFSGGIDSVCTATRLSNYDIYGITFSYGQRAGPEIGAARRFAGVLGMIEHRVVDVGFMEGLYGSSNVLTDPRAPMPGAFDYSIVVPVRNAVFLSVAAAWAYSIGAEMVAYGAHTGDTPYPDCRPAFAEALEGALNLGEEDGIARGVRRRVRVWSPYMDGISKGALLRGGLEALGDAIYGAWSCYIDGEEHCGVCESCRNRMAAFAEAGIPDKTAYAPSSGSPGSSS